MKRVVEQFNGREGETATLNEYCSIKLACEVPPSSSRYSSRWAARIDALDKLKGDYLCQSKVHAR